MEEKLFPRILEILLTRFDCAFMPKKESITIDSALAGDIGMESIDILDFLIAVETVFSVNLNNESVTGVRTIRDVILLVLSQKPSVCDNL